MMSFCSCFTWSLSLRLALYHLPRLLTDFCSDTVGIGSSPMKNLRSLSTTFTTEILRDLDGLIFMRAQLMFSSSFLSSLLVHRTVVVSVVISSMYALRGGNHSEEPTRCLLTTHFEARTMTSIVIMNTRGEMVHPTIMPTSKHCQEGVSSGVEKQNCKS